jgi:hypothetical protein
MYCAQAIVENKNRMESDKHSVGFSAAAIFSHTILDRLQKMAENIDRVS